MRCSVNPVDEDVLRKDLERFWNIESIAGTDECVIHKFERDIHFNGKGYVTRLPFRPDRGELSNNFDISKARLKRLRNHLEKTSKLDEYGSVFQEYE